MYVIYHDLSIYIYIYISFFLKPIGMIQKPWKVQKDPCQRTSIKTSPTRNQIPSLQQILWHTKLYVNHLSPPENSWDWWSLHPIPSSCHPFLKGHTWDTWIQKIESILDLSTHSDQPLFFGGGEGNRFMSVNDSFFSHLKEINCCAEDIYDQWSNMEATG